MVRSRLPLHAREERLHILSEEAGEAMTQPPLPPNGIPKQRLPGWIRWPLRTLLLPFVILDQICQRFARLVVRPPYKQVGSCKQRGNCCFYVLLPAPTTWLWKAYYFWNTEINGFFPRETTDIQVGKYSMRVMGCRYLMKNGRCRHHKLRPTVCREWPLIEYFAKPQRLKGCGFRSDPTHPGDCE